MSIFVDEDASETIDLDREYCPPKADGSQYHEHDTVTVRTGYGYGDVLAINKMGHTNPGLLWDAEMATLTLLSRAIRAWSFVNEAGEPVPVGVPMIRLLPAPVGEQIAEVADKYFQASQGPLPNPSGAPSRPSSPESLSALAKKKRSGKRSTPRSN
jgi:hypothetical protein